MLYFTANHHRDNLHLFQAQIGDRRLDIDLTELAEPAGSAGTTCRPTSAATSARSWRARGASRILSAATRVVVVVRVAWELAVRVSFSERAGAGGRPCAGRSRRPARA